MTESGVRRGCAPTRAQYKLLTTVDGECPLRGCGNQVTNASEAPQAVAASAPPSSAALSLGEMVRLRPSSIREKCQNYLRVLQDYSVNYTIVYSRVMSALQLGYAQITPQVLPRLHGDYKVPAGTVVTAPPPPSTTSNTRRPYFIACT